MHQTALSKNWCRLELTGKLWFNFQKPEPCKLQLPELKTDVSGNKRVRKCVCMCRCVSCTMPEHSTARGSPVAPTAARCGSRMIPPALRGVRLIQKLHLDRLSMLEQHRLPAYLTDTGLWLTQASPLKPLGAASIWCVTQLANYLPVCSWLTNKAPIRGCYSAIIFSVG